MTQASQDYAILKKFDFERPPVGVKFLNDKPKGLKKLDKVMDLCEMLVEAQQGKVFYVTKDEFTCIGPLLLGMVDSEPVFESGMVGPELEIFKDARANKRLYPYVPRIDKGTVHYVVFAPLDKLTFEPDVLVVTADLKQARPILRSVPYSTGDCISAKATHVATCAWMYIYPVVSGQINHVITGLGAGMEATKPFPAGLFIISVPWNLLSTMIENLPEMISMEGGSSLSGGDELRKHHKETKERLRQRIQGD